jgi:hypothetical protein
VYNLISKRKLSCLTYIGGLKTSREKYGSDRLNFRISEVKEKENKNIIDKEQNLNNYKNIELKKENLLEVDSEESDSSDESDDIK